ncbi:LOW QUALITY PROTEIN: cystatin-F [Pelodytes ibericus]
MSPIGATLLLIFLFKNDFSAASYIGFKTSTVNPGFPRNISTDDPNVKAAARATSNAYNNKSNDSFLFKEKVIQKARIQIVKGIKYMLHTKIGRTLCTKKGHANLDKCDFQQNTLKKVVACYSEVWNITWTHSITVPVLQCKEIQTAQLSNSSKLYFL